MTISNFSEHDTTDLQQTINDPHRYDLFLSLFRQFFSHHPQPDKSSVQFLRIWRSSLSRHLFLRQLIDEPAVFDMLSQLILKSEFFCEILVRDPHLFSWLTGTEVFQFGLTKNRMEKDIFRAVNSSSQHQSKIKLLKQAYRKMLVAIGMRDVIGKNNVKETVELLSDLADIILKEVSILCDRQIFENDDRPPFVIYALGKYGGRELNYSSDIDLIAITDTTQSIKWRGKDVLSTDVLQKWIQLFTDILTHVESDGFFYRVDFRLRPDGEFGPLIPTMSGVINYYFSRGRTWERQMLLKIRPVIGDSNLSDRFLSALKGYVFNPMQPIIGTDWLYQSLKAIHEQQEFNEQNIKTTIGGIRWIEFFCQAFQLEIGTQSSAWWSGNTRDILIKLKEENIISIDDGNQLIHHYDFFRKIEHYLQFYQNQQTHDIPKNQEELTKFSIRLGYHRPGEFQFFLKQALRTVQQLVKKYFPSQKTDLFSNSPLIKIIESFGSEIPEASGMLSWKPISPQFYHHLERILQSFPNPKSLLDLWMTDATLFRDVMVMIDRTQVLLPKWLTFPSIWESILFGSGKVDVTTENKYYAQALIESFSVLRYISGHWSLSDLNYRTAEIYKDIIQLSLRNSGWDENTGVVFACGKLGSNEIIPGGDADLIAFSHELVTQEQLISLQQANQALMGYTPQGFHFQVDFRLRPEGKNAPLVQSAKTFSDYLFTRADLWEFLTYCRMRSMSGSGQKIISTIDSIFQQRKSELMGKFITQRLARIQIPKTNHSAIHLKKDAGGLLDIETLLQFKALDLGIPFLKLQSKPLTHYYELLDPNETDSVWMELKDGHQKLRAFETEQKLLDTYKSGLYQPQGVWTSRVLPQFSDLQLVIRQNIQLIEKIIGKTP